MKRFGILLACLFVLLVFIVPVLAQVEPPDPPAPPVPGSFDEFVETLARVLAGVAFFSAPLTLLIVQILKFFIKTVPATWLSLIVGAALTVAYWVAIWSNLSVQFDTFVEIAMAIGPMILTLLGTLYGASILYASSVRNAIPFFSWQRTPGNSNIKPLAA